MSAGSERSASASSEARSTEAFADAVAAHVAAVTARAHGRAGDVFEWLLRALVGAVRTGTQWEYAVAAAGMLHALAHMPSYLATHPLARATVCGVLDRVAADAALLGDDMHAYVAEMEAVLHDVAVRGDFVALEASDAAADAEW